MLLNFDQIEERVIPGFRGGEKETVTQGSCHYCPKGHEHSLINDSSGDLIFFAVVPKHE